MRRRSKATAYEDLVVAEILRSSGDPRAEVLLHQFRSARLRRRITGPSLQLSVPQTTEDLLVDLDSNVTSTQVALTDLVSGQELSFSVTLLRGGFFGSLEGRVAGASWPRRWRVNPVEVRSRARGVLVLGVAGVDPTAVAAWLAIPHGGLQRLRAVAPASDVDIADLEASAGRSVPAAVKSFLAVSDGLEAEALDLWGVRDLYAPDFEDGESWWFVGRFADGSLVLCDDQGRVGVLDDPLASRDSILVVSPDFRTWLATQLIDPR